MAERHPEGQISVEQRGHVLLMGIDRPEKRNGLTPRMWGQLRDAYTRLDEDEDLFVGVLFSCDVNLIKPDHAIFELLLNRYDLEPQETIFIDDSEANTHAATQLGMKAIHFKDVKSTRRQLIAWGCSLPP